LLLLLVAQGKGAKEQLAICPPATSFHAIEPKSYVNKKKAKAKGESSVWHCLGLTGEK